MKRLKILLITVSCVCACSPRIKISDVAHRVADKGFELSQIEFYTGSCFLQGAAEYFQVASDKYIGRRTLATVDSLVRGDIVSSGSFVSYCIGGTAAAQLALWGEEDFRDRVIEVADSMYRTQSRNTEGVMIPGWDAARLRPDAMFIDGIFAITPYLLYSGLLADRQDWIDYSAWIAIKSFEVLRDHDTGLVHQARAVLWMPEGAITDDCWSRGNGWASVALAALVRDLPEDNRYRAQVCSLSQDFFESVLRYQDTDGLWHQEMTYQDCWQEVSGSALLLYGIGTAIDCGVLPKTCREAFCRGLTGLMAYIDSEGNISSVCGSCLAVRDGSKDAYAVQASYWNERHAFGPVMLALSAAARLGIRHVKAEMGTKAADRKPSCVVRHVESRKDDMAWENDWVAFRIYSQKSPVTKISSGVDYWAKTVDYPILDKWYELNARGGSYHEDEGEGYDFYAVGKGRGVGGSGVWVDGALYVSEPYQGWEITEDTPQRVSFTVTYPGFETPCGSVRQTTSVTAVLGTPYTRIETAYTSDKEQELTVAVGLSSFGHEEYWRDADGVLWLHEALPGEGVNVHSIIVTDPRQHVHRADAGGDRLLLMDVRSGEKFTYYMSACSNLTTRVSAWARMARDVTWDKLESIYETEYD